MFQGQGGVRIVWGIFGLGAYKSLIQTPLSGLPFYIASACSTEVWHIRPKDQLEDCRTPPFNSHPQFTFPDVFVAK